jgi:hypothetical protein
MGSALRLVHFMGLVMTQVEIESKKCVVETALEGSEFHARLLADTATRRKLKAREDFTVRFRFVCEYADQSEEHMSFIEAKMEILKGETVSFHQKNQQVTECSKREKLSGMSSSSLPIEKSRTWLRG